MKPTPIVAGTCTFSRALCRLRVITSSFDWFTGLSPSLLIGQSNYFVFGFTTLDWVSIDTRSKSSSNLLPIPDCYVHWSLWPAASFVIRSSRIFSVVLHIVSFSNHKSRLEIQGLCIKQWIIMWLALNTYVSSLLRDSSETFRLTRQTSRLRSR